MASCCLTRMLFERLTQSHSMQFTFWQFLLFSVCGWHPVVAHGHAYQSDPLKAWAELVASDFVRQPATTVDFRLSAQSSSWPLDAFIWTIHLSVILVFVYDFCSVAVPFVCVSWRTSRTSWLPCMCDKHTCCVATVWDFIHALSHCLTWKSTTLPSSWQLLFLRLIFGAWFCGFDNNYRENSWPRTLHYCDIFSLEKWNCWWIYRSNFNISGSHSPNKHEWHLIADYR